ncbi:MAG: undecaprenyl/decaprenyl-phosphate alpha-N-acetylglucosaminyl 1-phosphate transferase, partial [Bacteroidetes bacterium]
MTTLLIPPILRIANQKRLFDLPDHRKTHLTPTPALGGVGFFISFWLVIICLADFNFLSDIRFVLVAATLLFLVGVQDDLVGVDFSVKFVWQAFAAVMLFLSGFQMEGFYGVFGWGDLPTWGAFIMTLLTVVYLINAYNLIDGVNGLAGSLGVVGSAGFGALFWWNGEPEWSFMAMTMTGVLLGFLKYNYGKAKIFMGDNGSMFLGLMMSVFFIHYLNSAPAAGAVPPLLWALALVLVPAFDLLRVFAFRLLKRQSPFSADRTHIHHLLQALGKSHVWV